MAGQKIIHKKYIDEHENPVDEEQLKVESKI